MRRTNAIVFDKPGAVSHRSVELRPPSENAISVRALWSGISTGTERLLFDGSMPAFPGLGYPLVPGYETVGQVTTPSRDGEFVEGDVVFVPGAACYADAHAIFGGSAGQVSVPPERLVKLRPECGRGGTVLALAATAWRALSKLPNPELIVGHGVLGRVLVRLVELSCQYTPMVWDTDPQRRTGPTDYPVLDPQDDDRHDYAGVIDVSGASGILDPLISRLRQGGHLVLAGFYSEPLKFDYPPAFMREIRISVSAEFNPEDLSEVAQLANQGRLSFEGMISDCLPVSSAATAYRTAFSDPACLKMLIDWGASA